MLTENKKDSDIKIIYIKNINQYLKDFFEKIDIQDMKLYFNKTINKNSNFNDFVIKTLTEKQINFIKLNVEYSAKCLEKLNSNLKNLNKNLNYDSWKICVFSEMFFNLPFTLQDVIFIPQNYIDSCIQKTLFNFILNNNSINKNFSKTLIHEKLHLLQRYNQSNWDDYIIKNTKWIKLNKELVFNSSLLTDKIIYNPDTYYKKNIFGYVLDNKLYYGEMYINSKKEINNIWYEIVDFNKKLNLYAISYSISKYEHPYEELAYNLSNQIVNG